MKLNKKLFVTSLACLTISSASVFAAGYSTEMTSTSGLANSYAGSATGIHDSSDMFFNPAILTDVKDGEFILSVSYKNLTANPDGASTYAGSTRGSEVGDAGVDTTLPALYLAKRINENTTFGLAITSPFGLNNKYDENWQAKDRAVETDVATININPSLAYKLSEKLSVGAGLQVQYIKGTFTGMTAVGGGAYTPNKMHAHDWGYGYTLGFNYKATEKLKLGLGYRSRVDHKLTGTIQVIDRQYSDIQAQAMTPESVTAGTSYKLRPDIELAYDMTWTRWSRINNMHMTAYQNSTLDASFKKPRSLTWKDSMMHAIGANFTLNDKWLLRTGTAYEKETNTSVRIPVSDKIWASFGFNYKFTPTFSMDASYMHQFNRKARVDLNASTTASSLTSHYKLAADVFSLGMKKEF